MGARGPVPKKARERMGHRSKAEQAKTTHVAVTTDVKIPPARKSWHWTARRLYESLRVPEQAQFMQPSDWAAAQDAAETLTLAYKQESAEMHRIADRKWDRLLVTEAARRRAGIELERDQRKPGAPTPEPEEPESIHDHRSRLAVVS